MQVITIGTDGSIEGLLHKKGHGVDLLSLPAKATVTRASEVLFDDYHQKWYVEFRAGAGRFDGIVMTGSLLSVEKVSREGIPYDYLGRPDLRLLFTTYDEAVAGEIFVLNALRLQGKL